MLTRNIRTQKVLAEMVGTTRSRVNFFMNKFRKLGFIDYPQSFSRIIQGRAEYPGASRTLE